ncbi:hypothetical protein OOK31_24785 [Streptomyces sp. NBC_00249]|uniref:hypothetical protein n=1 Tax=Streptomyces sp. NBC_00249 TaxID=2975690 RepID=UPI00225949AF|nr:hypothetical protein [Streptomyces sp. NBC_00249]MCX5197075.1 hypothetical protein [Streptomyces sp. NBC_00249]
MDDGRSGRTGRRRFLTLTGGILLAGVAGTAAVSALRSSQEQDEPDPLRVRTDLEPLERRFGPALGPLSDAHWIGYDIDAAQESRLGPPSPDSRIRFVGLARLRPGRAAGILTAPGRTATPAPLADLPARLEPYVPAGAVWRGSAEFDSAANTEEPSVSSTGRFRFDEAHDLVCFDLLYLDM